MNIICFYLPEVSSVVKFIETENSDCQRPEGRRKGLVFNEYRISFGNVEKVVEMDARDGCPTV